jgi:hypothetical protein
VYNKLSKVQKIRIFIYIIRSNKKNYTTKTVQKKYMNVFFVCFLNVLPINLYSIFMASRENDHFSDYIFILILTIVINIK